MANKILTTDTYHEEIRGRLGVGEDVLSNADIDALSVLPIGETKIIAIVPNYDELIGDDQVYLYAATICMVASILSPSMTARIKRSKKDFDFSIENQVVDWNKFAASLIDDVYELIESISTVQSGRNVPIIGVAGPTRFKESERRGRSGDYVL